ncbi:hypothetical protein LOD99_12536 [Oopsacas minuta]|uniref:Uncharacterized protein n=1 Tax=Oopsacas minuta TaxID=111878 RepID=A0AAV7JD57_9METZ|nr:hypothetical protein LOD99_12536 [Oopsacas minuta]
MTSIKNRRFQNSCIRLNYAKTAKQCGMKHISILEILQYLRDDWEINIESFKGKVNWDCILHDQLKYDITVMDRREFRNMCDILRRNGVGVDRLQNERRMKFREYYSCKIRKDDLFRVKPVLPRLIFQGPHHCIKNAKKDKKGVEIQKIQNAN